MTRTLASMLFFASALSITGPATALAEGFKLMSQDIAPAQFMTKKQEFNGFGCDGKNLSPQLSWKNPPKGTVSLAITAYDPDAPTGSGWWHWQLVNIPKDVTFLNSGAGAPNANLSPKGSRILKNDYGQMGFGGACPPEGHGVHRYQFTIHALSQKLEIPEGASSALVGYLINANTIASSTLEALYKRD
ncbi:YbhB/YbcL family Raf kinase inhibitor-like protein [Pseudoteredinibacter isoporae]|uniref:YbhB/YbcL family Raf kinase inhibitor-like protein n=1 Tax=Pseudoteredinibacter isoporae TaxID=570281 RepID=A0A7X0JWU0_9GAMM|nr:YbhB/YbcL family Raf kinase inhibitor-like protein [Pseudoteredinibacter isoporae]MBB6523693.1 hypothetical protein [Pseudoteredinibacter isoporae]NHO89196.1 YbhB/YbcL family Raf kinase inhibitor-like protein [Pseudoteredinibacter isoporae]NIB22193.1 YbhB/YbcL family Raf kinase inhibitor-like protein [Pseudoteredinibacter isoporae]